MRFRSQSLRRILLTWLLLPLLVLFFLRGGYNYVYTHRLADRVYDRMLFTLASSLAQQIGVDSSSDSVRLAENAARLLLSDDLDTLYYAIRDGRGELLDGAAQMPPLPNPEQCREQPYNDGVIDQHRVRIACLVLTLQQQRYTLQVAETRGKRSMLSREFQVGILLPQLLIILLATFIVWFGIGKSLAPLRRLQREVSERSHLDLSALQETGVPAEVQPLIHSINDLMARLSSVLDLQNRFIADAAHQLRTPLAGLKAQLELALRQQDTAMTPDVVRQLLRSADRMTRLVNQLLALSRNGPSAEQVIRKQPLDLGALASGVTMEWVPRALEKGIDLGFEPPPQAVTLPGDAARLKELLDNLVDNALRYTPRHGQVTVSVAGGAHPLLQVTDTGPGIPPEQRERVFERFYSVLGNGAEGSGLGLAIVREIARMHGADARIEDTPDGVGTRVYVRF